MVFIDGGDILEVAPPGRVFRPTAHRPQLRRFLQEGARDPLHQESEAIPHLDWYGVLERTAAAMDNLRLSPPFWVSVARMILATVLAILLLALRLGGGRPGRWLVAAWVSLFRNTPLLVQLLFYFAAWKSPLPLGRAILLTTTTAGRFCRQRLVHNAGVSLLHVGAWGSLISAFRSKRIASGLRAVKPRSAGSGAVAGFTLGRSCAALCCRGGWQTPGNRLSASI